MNFYLMTKILNLYKRTKDCTLSYCYPFFIFLPKEAFFILDTFGTDVNISTYLCYVNVNYFLFKRYYVMKYTPLGVLVKYYEKVTTTNLCGVLFFSPNQYPFCD